MSHRQFVDLAARVPADESELDRGAVVISRAARLRWQREALSPPKEVGVWDHIRSAETVHFFCVVDASSAGLVAAMMHRRGRC